MVLAPFKGQACVKLHWIACNYAIRKSIYFRTSVLIRSNIHFLLDILPKVQNNHYHMTMMVVEEGWPSYDVACYSSPQ
jgi:hypothetical protein